MATKKEITIEDKLTSLYSLQLVDSKLDSIAILKGELPEEVSDLEDTIMGLNTRISRITEDTDELNGRENEQKERIKNSESLIEKYNKQLDDVKNNREFDALTKELSIQEIEIKLSQKRILSVKEELKAKKELMDTAQEKLVKLEESLGIKKKELDAIIKKTEKEEKQLQKKSDKARVIISERLLRAYDRVRNNYRNGLAVVGVERDSCGGCFNKIPPQIQLELAQKKRIIVCEHCGRILVDSEITEAAK
jgi:predicted  nucleic acid-binding Zn-ribbon protein